MAKCMVLLDGDENTFCGVTPEPGVSYEVGHQQLMRHLMVHLIQEMQGIRSGLDALVDGKAAEWPHRAQQPPEQPEDKIMGSGITPLVRRQPALSVGQE